MRCYFIGKLHDFMSEALRFQMLQQFIHTAQHFLGEVRSLSSCGIEALSMQRGYILISDSLQTVVIGKTLCFAVELLFYR